MSQSKFLTCGDIHVVWNEDDSVRSITYQSIGLIEAVNQHLEEGGMQALQDLIEDLLDAIATVPKSHKRRKISLADGIFGFKPVPDPPNPKVQISFWNSVMPRIWAWEDSHEEVHKGTIYSFMAESYLSLGDIPSAYICFFNALEEDKRNFPFIPKALKDAPAYRTTSIVDNPQNFLYTSVVMPLRAYLQSFIDKYNVRTNGSLKIQDLDQKFLQADPLEDVKRFFVATLHEIYHLSPLNSSRMINNDYSRLKIVDTLFNMGLIVDQILEHRFLGNYPGRKSMGKAVVEAASHLGWINPRVARRAGRFFDRVEPDPNGPPDQTLPSLLDGQATFDDVLISDPKMCAILVAYHLRNYGGHHLEGSDILISRYHDILDRIMDAVLASIELL